MSLTSITNSLNNDVQHLNNADQKLNQAVQQFAGTYIHLPSQTLNRKLIVWQVTGIPDKLKVPDLTMSINPQNLDASYTQLINRKRTLGGFIEEHWGEQLDSLSASGITRQFYGASGLTNENRRDSDGYKQFDNFVVIYRNNASVYDDKTGKVIAQGSIVMNYDSAIYNGYFETLSITEESGKPFNLSYNFTFKVTNEIFPGRIKSFSTVSTVSSSQVTVDIPQTTTLDITGQS